MNPLYAALVLALCFGPGSVLAQEAAPLSERERAFGDESEDDVPPAFRDEPEAVPPAFRDEADDDEVPPAFADDEDEAEDVAEPEPLPTIGDEDRLAVFELERGPYFSSDLGVFLTFGGASGSSSLQPYMAVHAGFDLNDFLSLQASVAGAFVADNPPSDNELEPGGQGVTSYQMLNLGAELVVSLRPFERIALEPKLGGGIAHITPTLTDPGNPDAVLSVINPQLTFGADLKYLTLLTGFTAGASFTGTYVLGPNIPGLGLAFHVRYTF